MSDLSKPGDYQLTLRPLRSEVPAINRLRRLLKMALRSCDLRCISVAEVPAAAQQTAQADANEVPS